MSSIIGVPVPVSLKMPYLSSPSTSFHVHIIEEELEAEPWKLPGVGGAANTGGDAHSSTHIIAEEAITYFFMVPL
jgi:hypothetical protein